MELPAELSSEPVNRALIESLKKKVEFAIRFDARQALELADLTLELSRALDDAPARAIGLRAKATALYGSGRYAEAIENWNNALDIYLQLGHTGDAAAIRRSVADALTYLGRYEEALQTAELSRAAFTALNDTIGLARLDTNVGNIYHRMDRNAEALAHYERAMAAFRAAGDSFGVAMTSYNAANVHSNLHEFAAARERYRIAEELYRQRDMALAAAQARYSVGYLDFLTGNYHQAMRTLHQIEPEFEQLGDTRMAGLCLLDLAEICLQMHVLDEAAGFAARAGERFQGLAMRYEEAKALMFRGLALFGLARFDDADRLLAESNRIFRSEGNSLYTGLTHLFRAELELERGVPAKALVMIGEARGVFERNDLGAKQLQARFIEAKALRAAGDGGRALQIAFEIADGLGRLNALWLETEVRELLGDLFLEGGDSRQAYEHYVAAVQSIEERRASIRVDDFRSAFMRDKLRVYEKLIRLCLDANTPEQNALAFYYVESRKARTLVDMLTNDLDLWPASAEADADLHRDWTKLREELHWLYSRLRDNDAAAGTTGDSAKDSRLVALNGTLRSTITEKEQELARLTLRAQIADPDFGALQGSAGLTVNQLRSALDRDDLLIEYYADGAQLAAFVIDHDSADVLRLPCTLTDIRERSLELKFVMDKFQYGAAYVESHGGRLLDFANDTLKWFHDVLFAPLRGRVANRNLVIVPFDVLHGLPFHALFDGSKYLIEHTEIATAPSARIYMMCRGGERHSRTRVSLFGAPDEFAPHIREEVETIRRWFPQARAFVGPDANRASLAAVAASSDVLHIASHAVFRPDNPMFSAFKLSDEWLNAYDISALRMNSTLVTLSGCSTGAGRVYAGDEMLGLVRSFLTAGAAALVVTLWPVNDPSAAALMGRFYEELGRGTSARAALRRAILDSKAHYAHPYYWAPFVLIGQD